MPVCHRCDLGEIDIGRALNRSERGKLKDKISGAEEHEREPDTLVTKHTTKAVTQRHAHGIKEQHDDIAAEQPDQRVDAGQTRGHLLA